MATTGGGLALGLPIGLIEPGFQLDAVAVAPNVAKTSLHIWPEFDGPEDVVQKIMHNVGQADITGVWVDGRRVVG
jgi:guanine deaminase